MALLRAACVGAANGGPAIRTGSRLDEPLTVCSPMDMSACPDEKTVPSPQRAASEGNRDDASAQRRVGRSEASKDAPPQPAAADLSDATLDTERFIPKGVIGRGTNVVIRAVDREILRDVAIKILSATRSWEAANSELAETSEVDRFVEEARINGQLEHPNIVPVYEYGIDRAGRRFLCMKLVEGKTLGDELSELGDSRLEPPHLAKLLQVFGKICDAVSFAHSRGVLHRDLKPKNVMISDFGQVYVLDWGIARLQPRSAGHEGARVRVNVANADQSELDPPGSLFGTTPYMAPEQLQGLHDKLDERTDVFGLGATLYQILSGQPPLSLENVRAIYMRRHPSAVVPPESLVLGLRVPPELSKIALRALAYDPADRYPSVKELQRDLESFQRGSWDLPRTIVSAGSNILKEGEPGDAAYVILDGRCTAYRVDEGEEVELRVMGPGEVFGETAIFSNKPRTASVRAVTDVTLVVVTREILSNALGLNSWMGAFVKALADRFREVDERLRALERTGRPPSSRP
jgi:serine/threonine protein kinase